MFYPDRWSLLNNRGGKTRSLGQISAASRQPSRYQFSTGCVLRQSKSCITLGR